MGLRSPSFTVLAARVRYCQTSDLYHADDGDDYGDGKGGGDFDDDDDHHDDEDDDDDDNF